MRQAGKPARQANACASETGPTHEGSPRAPAVHTHSHVCSTHRHVGDVGAVAGLRDAERHARPSCHHLAHHLVLQVLRARLPRHTAAGGVTAPRGGGRRAGLACEARGWPRVYCWPTRGTNLEQRRQRHGINVEREHQPRGACIRARGRAAAGRVESCKSLPVIGLIMAHGVSADKLNTRTHGPHKPCALQLATAQPRTAAATNHQG